jgi:hypothetical protein
LSLAQQSLFLSPGFRTAVYADLEVATKSGNEDQPQQVSEELAKRIRGENWLLTDVDEEDYLRHGVYSLAYPGIGKVK